MRFFLALLAIWANLWALDSSDSNLVFKNLDSSVDSRLDSRVANNLSDYFVSEKFDGIRALWDGQNMFSKSGKILAIPRCFMEKLAILDLQKGEFVEGELWIDYGAFEEISSVIRRKNPTCEDFGKVKYLIFNAHTAISHCEKREAIRGNPHCIQKYGSVFDMAQNLAKIVPFCDSANAQICVIRQMRVDSQKELIDFFNAIIAKGGEGVIVRDSRVAFKLKPQNDAECKIVDFSRGKGRIRGKVGAIICEALADKNSGIKNGIIFRIGSGLSDEMRENPPKIGTIITYKFSGVSKNGIPKHTRFLRIYAE